MIFYNLETLANEFLNLTICSPEFELLYYYYNLFCSTFDYDGDEELYDTQFDGLAAIDRYLWYSQAVAVFNDKYAGVQVLPAFFRGDINIAFLPDKWFVIAGEESAEIELNHENSVLIFNDRTHIPPLLYVYRYVKKIVDLEKTIDMNVLQQRTPYIFDIPEEQKKSAELFLKGIKAYSQAIFTRKNGKDKKFASVGIDDVKVLNTNVEFKALNYEELIRTYNSKILQYLGINSTPIEKSERLVTSEAEASKYQVYIQNNSRYQARKKALDRINKKFKQNYSIRRVINDYSIDGRTDTERGQDDVTFGQDNGNS